MDTKKHIREVILKKRNALSVSELEKKSQLICTSILASKEWKKATKVLLYLAYQSEVNLNLLITKGIREQKEIYVPKVIAPQKMEFFKLITLEEASKGYKGILEPSATEENKFIYNVEQMSTLMLLPGVGFDLLGNRLGYGLGFYDRFLEKKEQMIKIGICFELQVVNQLPYNEFDIQMNYICNEKKGIYKI
ncbi:MAG: 5-formyltetrahydrofolate cyclo-ligase [Lachnospiraceae bacterium]